MDDDEGDLRRFCGPVADRYLAPENRRVLDAMRAQNFALWPPVLSFCWPALVVPVQWLLFRKLYAEAAIIFFLLVVIAAATPAAWATALTVPLGLIVALIGHPLYLHKIARDRSFADACALLGSNRIRFAAKVGGRSTAGLWLGLATVIGTFATAFVQAFVPNAPVADPLKTIIQAQVPGGMTVLSTMAMIVPSLFWLAYCFVRFGQPPGNRRVWTMIGLGGIALFVASLTEPAAIRLARMAAGSSDAHAWAIGGAAGVFEEAMKLWVLAAIALMEFGTIKRGDYPKLGMWIGFGFGLFEALAQLSMQTAPHVAFLRAATGVPLHGCLGVVMGWGIARLADGGVARWAGMAGLLAVLAFLHGYYDFQVIRPVLASQFWEIGQVAPTFALIIAAALAVLRPIQLTRRQGRAGAWVGGLITALPLGLLVAGWSTAITDKLPGTPSTQEIIAIVAFVSVAPTVLGLELLVQTLRRDRPIDL